MVASACRVPCAHLPDLFQARILWPWTGWHLEDLLVHVLEAGFLKQVLVFGVVWHRATVFFGGFAHERRPFGLIAISWKRAIIGDKAGIVFAEFEPATGLGMSGNESVRMSCQARIWESELSLEGLLKQTQPIRDTSNHASGMGIIEGIFLEGPHTFNVVDFELNVRRYPEAILALDFYPPVQV